MASGSSAGTSSGPTWNQGDTSSESSDEEQAAGSDFDETSCDSSDDASLDVSEEEDSLEVDDETYNIPLDRTMCSDTNFRHIEYPAEEIVLRGKDGVTEWSNVPPTTGRRAEVNIWQPRDGRYGIRSSVQRVQQAITPNVDGSPPSKLNLFKLMITNEMLDAIVAYTNLKAETANAAWNSGHAGEEHREWVHIDRTELVAFVGLLYLAGAHWLKRESTHKLWRSDPRYKRHPFTATMSRERFVTIMKNLRFDDVATRAVRRQTDKLAAIREFSDSLQNNLFDIYEPQELLCVDEMLIKFRGRCPFRVYMKSKPGRYGIKVWALVDVKTKFVCNYQVYLGKEGTTVEVNQGKRVLHDMLHNFYGSGRGVTADNFFGSRLAAEELIVQKITSVFTIRPTRKEVPKELSDKGNCRGIPLYTSKFFWNDNSIRAPHNFK